MTVALSHPIRPLTNHMCNQGDSDKAHSTDKSAHSVHYNMWREHRHCTDNSTNNQTANQRKPSTESIR